MNRSTPSLPVHHHLPEFTQTHVHRVSDAIQPSHPRSSPSPPAPNPSQHQSLFQWVTSSHEVAKVLEFQLQHQSVQWIFRVDFLKNWLVWSPCCPRDCQESSPGSQFESINSLALSLLYGPTLMSIHDYWKNHSFDHTDLCQQSGASALQNAVQVCRIFPSKHKHHLMSWLQSCSAVILEPKKIKSVTASTFPPSCLCEVMGPDAKIFIFWMLSFKLAFSLFSFVPLHFLLRGWWDFWYLSWHLDSSL